MLPVVEGQGFSAPLYTTYRRSAYTEVCPECGRNNSPIGAAWIMPFLAIFTVFVLVVLVLGIVVSWQIGGAVLGIGLGGMVLAAVGYCFYIGYPGQSFGVLLMLVGTVWAVVIGQLWPLFVLGTMGVLFTGFSRRGPKG